MFRQFFALSFLLLAGFGSRAEKSDPANGSSRNGEKEVVHANILSIALFQLTEESSRGIGIQFEHFLGNRDKCSLYLPLAMSFYTNNHGKNLSYTYLYPGLKIYPWGSQHVIAYSVGPSLALGFGNRQRYSEVFSNGVTEEIVTEYNGFRAGMMLNNGINVRPGRFYAGLELGIGVICYSSSELDFSKSYGWLSQFQVKAGYRF